MTRIVFQDVDEFADALCGVIGRGVQTARSTKEWWVQNVNLGRVLTQTLQIGSAATFAGNGKHAVTLKIPLSDPAAIRVDGKPLEAESFLLITAERSFTLTTSDTSRWIGVAVPLDHALLCHELIESLKARLLGSRASPRTTVDPRYLDGIRSLVAQLMAAPNLGSLEAAAVRCAEEEIIAAVSRALRASRKAPPKRIGRPTFSRGRIVTRVLELMEASAGEPLFVQDLCRETSVSERTLRNVFYEFFGVGPMRLLRFRQLQEIRVALLAADPNRESVTRIASRFGVWDLSLFARNYKALFDESPSQTLRSAARNTQRGAPANETWLQHASRAFNHLALRSG